MKTPNRVTENRQHPNLSEGLSVLVGFETS